ncbi:MAG: hypothetical protein ACF8R7_07260 [Phycisphaerales bacterium JB039]
MAIIGTIALGLKANVGKFQKNMKSARKSTLSFVSATKTIGAAAGVAATALVGLGAAVSALGVRQLKALDASVKMADRLGLNVDQLRAFEFAAGQAGVSTNALQMGMQRLTRRVAEAARGTGEAQGALKELGIDAQSFSTLSADQQLRTLADRFAAVPNQADRVRLAFKLFDSEGVSLLQLLQSGSGELDRLTAQFRSFGGELGESGVARVISANNAMGRLGAAFDAIKTQIAVAVAPAIDILAKSLGPDGGLRFIVTGLAEGIVWLTNVTVKAFTGLMAGAAFAEAGFLSLKAIAIDSLAFIVNGLNELVFKFEQGIQSMVDALGDLAKFLGIGIGEVPNVVGSLSGNPQAVVDLLRDEARKAREAAGEKFEIANQRALKLFAALETPDLGIRDQAPIPVEIPEISDPRIDSIANDVAEMRDLQEARAERDSEVLQSLLGVPFSLSKIARQIEIAVIRQPHTVVRA